MTTEIPEISPEELARRKEEKEKYYARCLQFDCRHCSQPKGQPCRDTNLRKCKPHSDRRNKVFSAHMDWERLKTRSCPTCAGTGRVKVVGPDAQFSGTGDKNRLVPPLSPPTDLQEDPR